MRDPDLVVEITMQPVRRYGVDAAIFFSDIVVPLKAIGIDIDIKPGVGPVVADPIRDGGGDRAAAPAGAGRRPLHHRGGHRADQGARRDPADRLRRRPFTLATYLIEGGPSKNHDHTKAMMYGAPDLWHALMDRLTVITLAWLKVQADAGASALQLFDSWVGAVAPRDYREFVLPYTSRIFAGLEELGVPRIHFGVGTGELLPLMGEAGADVVGVDWRVPLDEAALRVGAGKALQGNLDPAILLAPWEVVEKRARAVVEAGRAAEGHVFNLGHGVLPSTDPGQVARLTDFVHEISAAEWPRFARRKPPPPPPPPPPPRPSP